jgi:hypothetical protein
MPPRWYVRPFLNAWSYTSERVAELKRLLTRRGQ